MALLTDKQLRNFLAKVAVRESGCHEWTACRNSDGYGEFGLNRRKWRAHRLSWTLAFGPIPAGQSVLHKCDNPRCCNPEHLFLGTQVENMADAARKGRTAKPGPGFIAAAKRDKAGEKNPHAKLTAHAVRLLRCGAVPEAHIAAAYGVTAEAVSQAKRGITWRNV